MEWLLIVIAIVFALLVLAIIAKGQNAPKWDGPWPFYAKRP